MEPHHIDVPDLGLKLEHSPALTRLQVPSRLEVIQWLGLAVLVAAPLFVWTLLAVGVMAGMTEMAAALIAASVVVILFAAVAALLVRRLRSGSTVTITRDRLVVKKPWATEEPLESLVTEARFEETPRAILVFGGGQKITIGSALEPAQRRAVVNFLTGVIDERVRAPRASALGSQVVSFDLAEDGVARASGASSGELSADRDPHEIRLLALCRGLKASDKRNLVHLASDIPQPVLLSALQSYLDIQDDEVLLSITGVPKQGGAISGCAVTSKRVYWPGKRLKSAGSGPPRCWSLDHASLPGIVRRKPGSSVLELGEGRRILCSDVGSLGAGLIDLLAGARAMACGDVLAPEISEHDRGNARAAWPRVVAANTEAKALQAEIRRYVSRTQIAARPVVTQLIVLACAGVFATMVAQGVSPLAPSVGELIGWGASSGRLVVIDHEYWRLFTAVFLYIGLFHILMNMFCLITAGPVVERMFGHWAFAALYTLSGIGGAIASVWAHPPIISAGASGAIFGIFGGLLGFLAIRHRDVPPAVLKPMRVGAIAFIGYNTLFSLMIPGIDIAAHLDGLATGFVCGLLMALVSPADARAASRLMPTLRRAGVAAIVALGLAGIGQKGFDAARRSILAVPGEARGLDDVGPARETLTIDRQAPEIPGKKSPSR